MSLARYFVGIFLEVAYLMRAVCSMSYSLLKLLLIPSALYLHAHARSALSWTCWHVE